MTSNFHHRWHRSCNVSIYSSPFKRISTVKLSKRRNLSIQPWHRSLFWRFISSCTCVLLADMSMRLPAFCALVTSLVVLFRDAPTQFKKVSFNSVDCKRCRWCMGPGPDLESPTKIHEKQLTRCSRSSNVSWLLKPSVVLIPFLQILIEPLSISSIASTVYLFIRKYSTPDIPYVCMSR